jgi:hypothetical protein
MRVEDFYGVAVVRPEIRVRLHPAPWRERLRAALYRAGESLVEFLLWLVLVASVAVVLS